MEQTTTRPIPVGGAPAVPAARKPNLRVLVPLALAGVAVGLGAWYFLSRPATDGLTLSGRIKGYETDVGAKTAGRIDAVTVREGDAVRRGQLLVRIDDAEVRAQLRGAEARLAAARQQAAQAELQISVLAGQVRQAELSLAQARGDARGRIDQAEAQLATTRAQLAQAEAQVSQARSDLRLARVNRGRYAALVREGATAQQQFDQAQATFEAAEATLNARLAAVEAARRQVAASEGALVQVRTAALNPDVRTAQLEVTRRQLAQARSQLAGSRAEVRSAEASRAQIEAQISYLVIKSPIAGVVTARAVEPGAVVTTGKTLLTLLDLDTVYLRGFVPEGQIGRVRVGQKAEVYLDSYPDRPFSGRVAAIDPQASFTPENIYFREERVKQAFGVKILLDDPAGFAKPGMPADARILVGDEP